VEVAFSDLSETSGIMEKLNNTDGHYDFLTGIPAFSSGVRAHDGYDVVRAVFERPLPWATGFDRVERHFESEGLSNASLCSVELRCPRPYSSGGFDAFNETYVERLLSMGVFEKGTPTPVGRTNVAPVDHTPETQSMYAFSYVRPATTEREISFVIAGGGEVRGGTIDETTIVRYGDVTEAGMIEKATFVLDVMERRLRELDLAWADARTVNVYTKHPVDGAVSGLIDQRVGDTSLHGVHRYRTAPPVEHIEFEMDVKGPTWELALP
jgi:hypothetical protein